MYNKRFWLTSIGLLITVIITSLVITFLWVDCPMKTIYTVENCYQIQSHNTKVINYCFVRYMDGTYGMQYDPVAGHQYPVCN